jgi:integrase/recombinase XerD
VVLRTAKTGTHVSCPLPHALAKSLLGLEGDTPFWTGESSIEKCASNWRKIFSRAFREAGVEGHPHQFRNTFAKQLLVKSVPVGFVASLLGHGKVAMTEKFGRLALCPPLLLSGYRGHTPRGERHECKRS